MSVVIPVLDAAAALARCLASIRAAAHGRAVEVIVVDNGSRDGSAAVAEAAGAVVLREPGLRVGALRNAGVRAGAGPIVAFVDADHEIAGTWVAAALEAFGDPRVGAAGRLCDPPLEATGVQRAYGSLRRVPSEPVEVDWLGAGNLAVRREVFEQVGGFDEALEACEDVDLCRRITGRGWRLLSVPGMGSVHHGDPATLGALFRGELWRGRDNLRVSVRPPLTWRTVAGLLNPVVTLVLLAATAAALVAVPWAGGWPLLLAAAALGVPIALRTLLMLRRGGRSAAGTPVTSVGVAAAYEIARALALVVPGTHRGRASASGGRG